MDQGRERKKWEWEREKKMDGCENRSQLGILDFEICAYNIKYIQETIIPNCNLEINGYEM